MREPLTIDANQLENVATKAQDNNTAPAPSASPVKKASKIISGSSEKWVVPTLADDFDLDSAKQNAFMTASYYMNEILNYDDLHVEMEPQEDDEPMGHVKDLNTGKLVNSYNGVDLLKLYSQNRKERGIIVDGRV